MDINTEAEPVESQIFEYLNFNTPKSFLLFAGAGSGKTKTLVAVLKRIKNAFALKLSQSGQKIAIITYTNAACEEIKNRLDYDQNFSVSTIHSFCWELIKPFSTDIKTWLHTKLTADIAALQQAVTKARDINSITTVRNTRSLNSKRRRLEFLDKVTSFSYTPTGSNTSKGSLNHSEVIGLAAYLLSNEQLMRRILVNKFPAVLIDESQDTNKELLESMILTQQELPNQFSLGLFGDMMQRVYAGGKSDLVSSLPPDWKTPAKHINYRCPIRIINLINNIRALEDTHFQSPSTQSIEGHARIFIVDSEKHQNKFKLEVDICTHMSKIADDEQWEIADQIKSLTLEHHMAAMRGGFADFFLPFLSVDRLRDAALNGQSNEIKFLIQQLIPLIQAVKTDEEFKIASIIRKHSPNLRPSFLEHHSDPLGEIRRMEMRIVELRLITNESNSSILEILKFVHNAGLLALPESFLPFMEEDTHIETEETDTTDEIEFSDESNAWIASLKSPFEQMMRYADYVSDKSSYDTHQGVKGLEYDRVMVILDDEEARGFLFSYEKLLGATPLSAKDTQNDGEGKDSTPKRSRRLLYVTCSRAKKSLAVVAYTKAPSLVKRHVLEAKWFSENEIIMM